jgi:peptidyl-tRNA hydrolase, PTH1 family
VIGQIIRRIGRSNKRDYCGVQSHRRILKFANILDKSDGRIKKMKLIIGLGNPGSKYTWNRHNTGFHILDMLAEKHCITVKKTECNSLTGAGEIGGVPVILAKPKTYVNVSGKAVSSLMAKYDVKLENVIVIHDDLDMPLGRIRVRPNGSSGGHNGLKSIIAQTGSAQFDRVKVGIGRPDEGREERASEDEIVDYVLSDFTPDEKIKMLVALRNAAAAVETILAEGMEAAMNKFNKAAKGGKEETPKR